MSFRNEESGLYLALLNQQSVLPFFDVTADYDWYDTAVGEYNGVILQLTFPDRENGYHYFNLMCTDISKAETTVFFQNDVGSLDLSFEQVLALVKGYVEQENRRFSELEDRKGH